MPLQIDSLSNKIILLTGANRGIGLATAKELSARGACVVAGVRDPDRMPKVDGVEVLELDTADAASSEAFVNKATAAHGRIDGLINNAAILIDQGASVLKLSEDDLRRVIDVNLIGPLRLCQLVVPGMVERGYGRVVNVSSGLGAINDMGRGYPSYRLTKLALNGLTRILAADLGRAANVKVNSLDPGWVRTDMGGAGANRDPSDPAREIADLISISANGPSGGLFRYGEPTAW